MKVLVVGGGGFIGTHLARRLLEGGYLVRVFDRSANRFIGLPYGTEFVEKNLATTT